MKWVFVYLFFAGTSPVHTIEKPAVTLDLKRITRVEHCLDEALNRQNAINEVLYNNPPQPEDPDYVLVICRRKQ